MTCDLKKKEEEEPQRKRRKKKKRKRTWRIIRNLDGEENPQKVRIFQMFWFKTSIF